MTRRVALYVQRSHKTEATRPPTPTQKEPTTYGSFPWTEAELDPGRGKGGRGEGGSQSCRLSRAFLLWFFCPFATINLRLFWEKKKEKEPSYMYVYVCVYVLYICMLYILILRTISEWQLPATPSPSPLRALLMPEAFVNHLVNCVANYFA